MITRKRIVVLACVGVMLCAAMLPAARAGAEDTILPWQNSYAGEAATGDHVLGLWQFDAGGETVDSSGNGHALTLRGDSRFVPEGRFGACLESFSAGKADKAQGAVVKNHPKLTPPDAFTLELWIKPKPEMDQDKMSFLLDKKFYHYPKDLPTANFDYCLFMTRRGKNTHRITTGLGFGKDSSFYNSSDVLLPPGKWYHVAFTYDGKGAGSFFLNGKPVGRTVHKGRGPIAPGKYDLLIGARYRGSHIGFPGYIDQVRICKGVVRFAPPAIEVGVLPGRAVFARMEPLARRRISLKNDTGRQLTNAHMRISLGGIEHTIPLPVIPVGELTTVDVPIDTTVRPDSYTLRVTVSGSADGGEYSAEQSTPVVIAPRPRADTMPVVMWAWTNTDIKRLKEIGFTHVLDPNIINDKKVWDVGQPTEAMDSDQVAKVFQQLDTHLAAGVGILHYVYPGPRMGALDKNGRWLGKKYLRINREGDFYKSPNLCGLFPRARKFAYDVGASVAKTYWHHPAVRGALIHSERRDRTDPCFHEHDKKAFQEFAGFPIPREIVDKNGVAYDRIKGFPGNRIVPDNDRILTYYRWFWKDGDGWNPLHTEVHKGLMSTGSGGKWTFFDPAVRAPSLWGSGGDVDVISHWTYSYPDPIKIGQTTDELFAMAAGRPGQKVMKMTQAIWYRHQTAPTLPKEKGKWTAWEKNTPPPPAPGAPAGCITISPDHLREAFWSKISRPVAGIMYHGWGSLVGKGARAYHYTNPQSRVVLTELIRDVVQPLGPMLLLVPDRGSDVALLESFASQVFAGRGTHGWGRSWEADMHLILQWAQIQPRIIYDETILRDGLSDFRVLVTPSCDVLTEGVAQKIAEFQRRGGILVADERLPRSLVPDIVIQHIARSGEADKDKAALQAGAADLRQQIDPLYSRHGDSSNPDVIVRFRQYGSTDYLFAVNDKRTFGDYVGHHGLVMEKGLPASATLCVRRKGGYVYDLVRHKSVSVTRTDNELRFEADFGPGGGRLFMITDAEIDGVRVKVTRQAKLGERVRVDLTVADAQGRSIESVVPVEVQVLDPQNRLAEGSGYYGAKDGKLSLVFDLAGNDLAGDWAIHAKELASGQEIRRKFTVVARNHTIASDSGKG